MLCAVADGHAEVSCSCEPDLFIDGIPACDQITAHKLAHYGFVELARTCSGTGVRTRRVMLTCPVGQDRAHQLRRV